MAKTIKLLLVMPTMGYGGTERQILYLCQGLNKRLFDVTLLVLKDEEGYLDEGKVLPVKVKRMGLSHCYNLWHLPRLIRYVRSGRFDILHALLPVANFWGGIAGRLGGVKCVISSSRNIDYPPPRSLFRLADRLAFRHLSDRIVTNSFYGRDVLCEEFGLNSANVKVILNGIDQNEMRPRRSLESVRRSLGISPGIRMILSAGRITEQKGLGLYVAMADVLFRRNPQMLFFIAGDGKEKGSLQRQIDRLPARNNIKILGFRRDLPELIHAADAFVLTSNYEGCPNVLLEAMAIGTPVVATDIGPHREMIQDGKNGLLTSQGNPQAMADAVQRLIEYPRLLTCLIREGRKTLARYGIRKMAEDHERLYLSALGLVRGK